jgi:LacI family transcriptional regulator
MQQAFDHLFTLPEPPTALFTSNDFIAYEFMDYAESRGLRVPDDLSVVGHGNIDRYVPRPFLTSVDQPFEMIGKAAAKLLLKRLSYKPGPVQTCQQIVLQSPLIVRQSCRRIERPEGE